MPLKSNVRPRRKRPPHANVANARILAMAAAPAHPCGTQLTLALNHLASVPGLPYNSRMDRALTFATNNWWAIAGPCMILSAVFYVLPPTRFSLLNAVIATLLRAGLVVPLILVGAMPLALFGLVLGSMGPLAFIALLALALCVWASLPLLRWCAHVVNGLR